MKTHYIKIKILPTLIISILVFVTITLVSPARSVDAAEIKKGLCGGTELKVSGKDCKVGHKNSKGQCIDNSSPHGQIDSKYCSQGRLNNLIKNVVNILSMIVGIVAVVMIIIGGFKYVTSGGDSGSITSAKHTIIYAIVGLIIVALAQVIVRFVLSKAT